jgi:hypothetical protein
MSTKGNGEAIKFIRQHAAYRGDGYIVREHPHYAPVVGEQGFVTSAGRFVGREEARQIAEAAEQLIPSEDNDGVAIVRQHPQLFSEDVW